MDYRIWTSNLHKLIINGNSLFQQGNGVWRVSDRKLAFEMFGASIFDSHIDILKKAIPEVLRKCDPKFELIKEERFAARLYGKIPVHSNELRKGLAETLVLLRLFDEKLINCTPHKARDSVRLIIHETLNDADWKILASINEMLPILAEADPEEYLTCMGRIISNENNVFEELFSQEASGITGSSTISGILWSLECLAWDKNYLQRAILLLGELAALDPYGKWSNRPEKSITSILLPWFPQTTANAELRLVALKSLKSDFPGVAWKVLLSLLPNHHQISMGTYKPKWNEKIPTSWEPKVLQGDYHNEILCISEIVVEMAKDNIEYMIALSSHLDEFPEVPFLKLVEYIKAIDASSSSEKSAKELWKKLKDIVSRHRKYPEAGWAFNADKLSLIDQALSHVEPTSLFYKYEELFGNRDFELVDASLGWEESQRQLQKLRCKAILEILNEFDELEILKFAEDVKNQHVLGFTCGLLDEFESISIVPEMLISQNAVIGRFCDGFVAGRFTSKGWDWINSFDRTMWSIDQSVSLLVRFPFVQKVIEIANEWLAGEVAKYWQRVSVNPYQYDSALAEVIAHLVRFGRYADSIVCLFVAQQKGEAVDIEITLQSLLGLVVSSEQVQSVDSYQISEIIKAIQCDERFSKDQVCDIEWSYLPVLGRHDNASPRFLNTKLASEPEYFHLVVSSVYRSDKIEEDSELESEQGVAEKKITENCWRLLNEWTLVPGLNDEGKLDNDYLSKWMQKVEILARESGHLEIAMQKIGETLFYTPPDENGNWIIEFIAEILNRRGNEYDHLRTGYSLEVHNSRGAHIVDPEAKPEKELSALWLDRSEEMLRKGFSRFSATLSAISEAYNRDAERIISGQLF